MASLPADVNERIAQGGGQMTTDELAIVKDLVARVKALEARIEQSEIQRLREENAELLTEIESVFLNCNVLDRRTGETIFNREGLQRAINEAREVKDAENTK